MIRIIKEEFEDYAFGLWHSRNILGKLCLWPFWIFFGLSTPLTLAFSFIDWIDELTEK